MRYPNRRRQPYRHSEAAGSPSLPVSLASGPMSVTGDRDPLRSRHGSTPSEWLAPGTHLPGYLAAAVGEAAARFGERPAFISDDGSVLSYVRLHEWSDEIAAGLQNAGIGPGHRVGLSLDSTVEWVAAYVAAAKAGATVAGVNPRLTSVERQACLDRVEPSMVLADPDDVLRLARSGSQPSTVPNDPDRPVAVVFTSGTSGAPKGAWFSDHQLTAVTRYDLGPGWGTEPVAQFGSTQFAHVGFTTKLPWYLRLGTTTHLLSRWRAGDVLDLIEREQISTIGAVAPQVALMLRDPDFDSRNLDCVKLLIVGGAASPPALVREARKRFGAGYSIRWSSTEGGGVGTATGVDDPDEIALHSVGRPRPGMTVEARDGDGRPLPTGEAGELWLRSRAVMSGYWNDPEATAHALSGGWLRTGDMGMVDPTGCVTLTGRRSDMYIRGGYNVHPDEVASALSTCPGVAQVAVAPRPDPVLGEIGVAIVVPRAGSGPPTLDELRSHGATTLARFKLPEALVVVDSLPLTPMQKLDRGRLIELARASASR